MNWYFEVWKKYASFGGRAGRQEYWYFVLFNILANILLGILAAIIGAKVGMSLWSLYSLAVAIPSLAVSVRRLHDNGRSGWWLLIAPIPGIGPIVLLVFMLQGSQEGENQYGSRPAAALA